MEESENTDKIIKNIVISGGGHSIITFYGILKRANKMNFYKYENIESIYGTSAGALVGCILSLNIDWEVLDKYIIERPWEKVFYLNIQQVFSMFDNMGIFSKKHIVEVLKPLLMSKDLSVDITLEELYQQTKIDFHAYGSELNSSTMTDFSHTSHPHWKVVDAVYISCAIPFIFRPFFHEDCCYIDGCITNDFPVKECLESHNIDETFFIKKEFNYNYLINENSPFVNYMNTLIQKLLIKKTEYTKPKYIVFVNDDACTLDDIIKLASSKDMREEMILNGIKMMDTFLHSIEYFVDEYI